jgi:hypothetical protein
MADSLASASDAELLTIASQVLTGIQTIPTNFGLTAGFVTNFELMRDTYDTDLSGHVTTQAAAKAQTITKDGSRNLLIGMIREVRLSSKAAKTPAAEYATLGIPSSSDAAPSTATVPIGQIDTSKRMEHTVSFRDAASEDTKKKPRGVIGCEIWVKIGEPAPGNQKDCVFLSLDTQTPYTALYDPEDAGKTAYYMLRWAMRDGSVSAWGETISATITA